MEQARVRCMGMARAVSLFAALSLAAASARAIDDGGDLEAVRRRGVLRHLGVPHANFITGSGDGFDVELMRRFAQRLGVSYEFVQTGWAEALPELVGRRARRRGPEQGQRARVIIRGDVVATGMTRLGGRSPGVVFSTPVLPAQVWVVAAADSTVSPIRPSGRLEEDIRAVKARLAGRALLAVPGTSLDPSLYGLAKTGARLRLLKLQLDEVAPALIQGEAELALLEVEDATTALERYPGRIKVIGPVSGQQAMAVAFRAGAPQLREAFEAFLAEAHRDGSYDGLVAAYFPGAPAYFREFFAEPF